MIGIDGLHARLAPYLKLFSFEHHLRESQKDEEVARDAGGLLGLLWGMIGETIHAHVCACNMGNRVLCAGVASLVPLSIYTRPRARALSRVRACSVSLPPPHALGVRRAAIACRWRRTGAAARGGAARGGALASRKRHGAERGAALDAHHRRYS